MNGDERVEIQKVIQKAYIQGIHGDQDESKVKSGFHPDFRMLVFQDETIEKVSVDEWLQRVEGMKADNPELWEAETKYSFDLVDAAGNAAVAKLNVHKGEVHFSTDYMLLYKFSDGWQVVSKIFSVPE